MGYVDFGKKFFFEVEQGKTEENLFKTDSIKITKGTLRIRGLITTNGLVLPTWDYPKASIIFFSKLTITLS